jgi:hypothetical protein
LSSRFVRLSAIQTGLSSIATFSIGYYIDWRGFTDLYEIGLVLQCLSIFIVLVCFRSADSNHRDEQTPFLSESISSVNINNETKDMPKTTSCAHFFQIFTVFRYNRLQRKKSFSLLLMLFSNVFYTLASSTFAPFLWFLLNAPFCWTSKDIGNYSAIAAISYAILSVLGMQALTNMNASDAMICSLSQIFFGASSLWLAFSQHDWELYAGLFLSAFSGYQGALIVSMMSTCLHVHQRSQAFTLVTEINTIMNSFGTAFFNWIYARTVDNCRTCTLFLGAGLSLVPLTLNMFVC